MSIRMNKNTEGLKWFFFVLPALSFYLIFFIIPSSSSLYFSLTDWDGMQHHFIGFKNFREMFAEQKILESFKNTIMYAVLITIIQNSLGMVLAVFMNLKIKGINALRMLFFMPAIFSSLVIGFVWGFILEPNIGVINSILGALKLNSVQMNWLGDPSLARWMIIFVSVWQSVGYSMVIYLAGLQTIPKELFESADIDGAKGVQVFRLITFPLIAPSVTINVVLSSIGCLSMFNQILAMTNGGPGYSTHSVATMIYTLGFGSTASRWGYGAAMSTVLFVFIFLLTLVQVTYLRKREVEM